ncbi:MAG: ABC transporter permease, partial [Thermoplasmata archaeon]
MGYTITSLRRRPGRSALTMLGVGLATGLVIILLALSAGIQTSSTSLATASGVDLLAVSANTTLSGAEFPYIAGAHQLPSAMARADPNVVAASPWLVGSLTYGNASLYAASNSSASGSGIPSG